MIKLLIVEDSPVIQEFLNFIFTSDPEIEVIGIAKDGIEAVEKTRILKPNVISMDIHMPKMNGLEAIKEIMSTNPVPIVVVSGSHNSKEVAHSFEAVEAGALAVLQRPPGIGHPDYQKTSKELIRTVKLMSEVKVVRRWLKMSKQLNNIQHINESLISTITDKKIIAIGASTGGPMVIQKILSALPLDFSVPILIVQHMSDGFIQGFVEWINRSSSIQAHVAENNEKIIKGNIYIAPDGAHMGINKLGQIILEKIDSINGHRPSVSYLFRTVAENYENNAMGILLTGMGKDGAAELKLMKDRGSITIAQDKESAVVFGMPGEAVNINAAVYILSPEKISAVLSDYN